MTERERPPIVGARTIFRALEKSGAAVVDADKRAAAARQKRKGEVGKARAAGITWREIEKATGLTYEAMRQWKFDETGVQ